MLDIVTCNSVHVTHTFLKWDQTVSNFVVKTGIGFSVGIVASALLFKSKSLYGLEELFLDYSSINIISTERTWPIAIATGWGFGVAYADAQVWLDMLIVTL